MFEDDMLCPHCKKRIGKVHSSDFEHCHIKLLKSPPKSDKAKAKTMQSKCHACGKLVYIVLGFND